MGRLTVFQERIKNIVTERRNLEVPDQTASGITDVSELTLVEKDMWDKYRSLLQGIVAGEAVEELKRKFSEVMEIVDAVFVETDGKEEELSRNFFASWMRNRLGSPSCAIVLMEKNHKIDEVRADVAMELKEFFG